MNNLRKILWPFSIPYDGVTRLRNLFFDQNIFKSESYDFPVIGIGNLSTGGTGKSPMTEYVISLLKDSNKVATLSRGYGRETKGYLDVTTDLSASQTGDEPLQFARKFKDLYVAVSENRVEGIKRLLEKNPKPDLLILDDVYQHRKVKPGLLILLTAYSDLFYKDLVLPAGNLRESRSGANRADCVVVTKCPENLPLYERYKIIAAISKYVKVPIYFAQISYGKPQAAESSFEWETLANETITVVTGIAKPEPFLNYLDKKQLNYKSIKFGDHHNFTDQELKSLDVPGIILTTEKDFVRLNGKLKIARLLYVPIVFELPNEEGVFNKMIVDFVEEF